MAATLGVLAAMCLRSVCLAHAAAHPHVSCTVAAAGCALNALLPASCFKRLPADLLYKLRLFKCVLDLKCSPVIGWWIAAAGRRPPAQGSEGLLGRVGPLTGLCLCWLRLGMSGCDQDRTAATCPLSLPQRGSGTVALLGGSPTPLCCRACQQRNHLMIVR